MIGNLGQMLSNGLSGAVVVHLLEDVGPSVFEEVERWLSIEGEHGEPIGGGHAVSKELHTVTGSCLGIFWSRLGKLRNPHNGVLAASEDAGVRGVMRGDELH